jgi:succinate dehydrogenase / fumarate reductase membrane anchor subunit
MSYRTAKSRVTGLGAAHGGTHHWWTQRISSVALIPLTILFVIPFAQAVGAGHEAVLATYSSPLNAIVAALFLAVTFHHLAQGLQVVIEDYIHTKGWRTGLLIGNTLFCATLGFAGVFAVLKIAFAG